MLLINAGLDFGRVKFILYIILLSSITLGGREGVSTSILIAFASILRNCSLAMSGWRVVVGGYSFHDRIVQTVLVKVEHVLFNN